ncbi:MAG: hypothetical protein Q8R16_02045, partial [bacterium]|nr:hypothetical protein [bacterium]
RGVVHLSVENDVDNVTGGPAKLVTVREVVGNIERPFPAAGVRWLIVLASRGKGKLGLDVGRRIPDSNKLENPEDRLPFAFLWHVQNELWAMQRYGQSIGQVFGVDAHLRYEAWRQEKRHPKKGGKSRRGQRAQGAAAPAAETPAEDTAPAGTGTPDATATGGTPAEKPGKPGKPSGRPRDRGPKADAASGGNGVAPGTAATPAPAGDDPPTT